MRTVVILHPICIIMSEYGKEKPRRVVTGTKAIAMTIEEDDLNEDRRSVVYK